MFVKAFAMSMAFGTVCAVVASMPTIIATFLEVGGPRYTLLACIASAGMWCLAVQVKHWQHNLEREAVLQRARAVCRPWDVNLQQHAAVCAVQHSPASGRASRFKCPMSLTMHAGTHTMHGIAGFLSAG